MKTITLQDIFTGRGEVKGFEFIKIDSHEDVFMYEVDNGEGVIHFEVFRAKLVPLCIDYAKKIFSSSKSKYVYPKARSFGISAWTFNIKKVAVNKFNELIK